MSRDGLVPGSDGTLRCWWGAGSDEYRRYHDDEWGVAVRDDARLFEKLVLEGFQSGLSWLTILRKRENFRRAFSGFDFRRVARYTSRSVDRLLRDAGIVRHRGKIEAAVNNAKRACELADEFGSLAAYFWGFEPGRDSRPERLTHAKLLTMSTSPESVALSRDLKRRGWRFVGPTTCYAFLQAMGLVNDHLDGCAFRAACEAERARLRRPRQPRAAEGEAPPPARARRCRTPGPGRGRGSRPARSRPR